MDSIGIDYRGGSGVLFRTFLQDSSGLLVTTGTVRVYIEEYQNDGTLKSYDFNDNTFKTGALTTSSAAMTHRTGNNSTRNTGLWTYSLGTTTGFTAGNMYVIQSSGQYASPTWQSREIQYGSGVLSAVTTIDDSSATTIADITLKRDFSSITGEASRSLLNAGRFIRNRWYVSGDALYVTKEDDSTTAWSGAVVAGGGSGVSSMDPY